VRRAAAALALGLAAGCLGRPAPPDRYFRLEAEPPARLASPVLDGTLVVDRLRADALTRGTALLEREGASPELRKREYAHWIDSPTLLIQREMAAALAAAGLASRVVTPETRVPPDHSLGGELRRFEEVRGDGGARAVVELELAVVDERRGRLRLHATYREEAAVAGPELEASVRAYDAALSAILARVVADAARVRP
jgi:cholesterol transport system auxiliary component